MSMKLVTTIEVNTLYIYIYIISVCVQSADECVELKLDHRCNVTG